MYWIKKRCWKVNQAPKNLTRSWERERERERRAERNKTSQQLKGGRTYNDHPCRSLRKRWVIMYTVWARLKDNGVTNRTITDIWKMTWKKTHNWFALQISHKWEDEGRNGRYEISFMRLARGTPGGDGGTGFTLFCTPSARNAKRWPIKYRDKHKGTARHETEREQMKTYGLPLKMICEHGTKKIDDDSFWKRYSITQLEKTNPLCIQFIV